MKHRFFAFLLAAVMLLSTIPAAATETEAPTETTAPQRAPGYCGDAIMWSYENGTLTLTGTALVLLKKRYA